MRWYVHYSEKKEEPAYYNNLEAVMTSLIYNTYDCKGKEDYNWHIALSPMHESK